MPKAVTVCCMGHRGMYPENLREGKNVQGEGHIPNLLAVKMVEIPRRTRWGSTSGQGWVVPAAPF